MKRLAGKVVVITGSSAGIGKEVAHQAAREGARVVLNARSRERLLKKEEKTNMSRRTQSIGYVPYFLL
jgi:hypothetical protein